LDFIQVNVFLKAHTISKLFGLFDPENSIELDNITISVLFWKDSNVKYCQKIPKPFITWHVDIQED